MLFRSFLGDQDKESSYHLFPIRLAPQLVNHRSDIISAMKQRNIACNVHFIPLFAHSFYQQQGFNAQDYPVANSHFQSEISLPVFSSLEESDAEYLAHQLIDTLEGFGG